MGYKSSHEKMIQYIYMSYPFVKSPYFQSRQNRKITAIILHTMQGSYKGTISYFQNNSSQVSAHYCVDLNGDITQMVDEKSAANHAGIVSNPTFKQVIDKPGINPNTFTIGIEHADNGSPAGADRSKQYPATIKLVKEICARYEIPIDREHICGHREVRSTKSCPGNLDVDYIVREAKGAIMPTTPSGDLQKIFDYYSVKSVDELIHMVDEQLGFLKDARSTNQKLMLQNNALTETSAFLNNQVTDFKNQSEQNQAKADQAKKDLENLWEMITKNTPTTVKNGDSTSLVAYFTQYSQNEDAIVKLQKDNQSLKDQQTLQQQEMLARITTLEQALNDKNAEILVLSTQLSQLKAQVQAIGEKPVVVLKKSWLQSILEFMTRIKEQK